MGAEEEMENPQQNPETDYIKTIQDLKENTVSKELYEKLKEDNRRLLDTLVQGGTIENPPEEKESIDELRKKLFSEDSNLNNIEFVSAALDLRDALIAEGKPDPFLPFGHDVVPTKEEEEQAERLADVLHECVEYAEGDNSVFTNELQRRTIDVKIRK